MKREDRLTEFGDGGIEQIDRTLEACLRGNVDELARRLQLKTGSEQTVNDGVVETFCDAFAVVRDSSCASFASQGMLELTPGLFWAN